MQNALDGLRVNSLSDLPEKVQLFESLGNHFRSSDRRMFSRLDYAQILASVHNFTALLIQSQNIS